MRNDCIFSIYLFLLLYFPFFDKVFNIKFKLITRVLLNSFQININNSLKILKKHGIEFNYSQSEAKGKVKKLAAEMHLMIVILFKGNTCNQIS